MKNAIQQVDAEVIIVDNASVDQSVEIVKHRFPEFKIIANKDNVGFSKANNQALAIAQGAYIHYLNPDTIIEEDYYIKNLQFML